ncbi:hypothetical protein jhhlp_005657 [Lomentospora prolificans]|uniref:RING-type domain-containing protein n=1 Tax=Lomentospora prolificans TaxID=41688 RepID=A0A2N3N3P3_9PEZI|nr:hypothetical protein jhhlp_005657 [Lomentospora prolificans]
MKFAHTFAEELKGQDFPPQWIELAIPYRQLKKCLKMVQRELAELGLGPDTLSDLLEPSSGSPVILRYRLEAASPHSLRPQLTVAFDTRHGIQKLDVASLGPATKTLIDALSKINERSGDPGSPSSTIKPTRYDSKATDTGADGVYDNYSRFEVPLTHDDEFFNILLSKVIKLDGLQATQERRMSSEIIALRHDIGRLSKPTHIAKTDLDKWRTIFSLYLDAQVFFSTLENDHGFRELGVAARQLAWFRQEVEKLDLIRRFRLPESRLALDRFFRLNVDLLRNLRFQEINKLAVAKILKSRFRYPRTFKEHSRNDQDQFITVRTEFDKRTSLAVTKLFPNTAGSGKLLTGTLARDMCAQISNELVAVVPQLSDYLCPVCFSIAFRPIRLSCQHVFCIRCVVKLQRRREKQCPLCRSNTVMTATPANLDIQLEKFLRKYFPTETREKKKANELERGIETYGPGYRNDECRLM